MAPPFCSQLARSHGVSPAGTATEAAHWLLIEDPSPWGEEAVEAADWFPEVREGIRRWQEVVPDLRVQLIRQGLATRDAPDKIRCLAVRAGPELRMQGWTLGDHEDLAALPVPDALQGSLAEEAPAPLVLTCVNGRRDACCAKWGRPVAQAAAEAAPDAAWRTSHLGGHRFAPTALVLPHGTHYAWLRPDDMADLVAAHRRGHVYDPERMRGAVHQPRPVQAACLALRRTLDETALGAVQGTAMEVEEQCWTVRVEAHGTARTAHVRKKQHEVTFPHSCGSDDASPKTSWQVTWSDTPAA